MNIVIVGYGRVGSTIARDMLAEQHHVTIIDNKSERVQRAARLQGAKVVMGNAVDVQVQRDAGVASADCFVAVTTNDNVNLVACQVALEVFQVTNVFARVYASARAEVTAQRGVVTVCPTRFTVETFESELRRVAGEAAPHSQPLRKPLRPRTPVEPVDESKFVVIAGGGRVGFHLARSLIADGHEVALIERDPRIAAELSGRLDCPVIVGDGSMPGVLEEAGAGRCRVFAAVTGRDEDNLIACQTAKALPAPAAAAAGAGAGSGTAARTPPKTIARVSDPNNEDLYRALGVDATVSSTSIIRSFIERELPTMNIKTLLSLTGGLSILELTLQGAAPVVDKPLRDIVLPKDSNVVAILRGSRTVVPRGDTVFKPGDVVLTLVSKESEKALRDTLQGDAAEPAHDPHGSSTKAHAHD
jgi:trk/ktr system potassium uptake protein